MCAGLCVKTAPSVRHFFWFQLCLDFRPDLQAGMTCEGLRGLFSSIKSHPSTPKLFRFLKYLVLLSAGLTALLRAAGTCAELPGVREGPQHDILWSTVSSLLLGVGGPTVSLYAALHIWLRSR